MQIATQHAKAVGECSRVSMEERLLLNRIALHSANVAPRNIKSPATVVANFANAGLSVGYRATVSAGITAHTIAIKLFNEVGVGLSNTRIEDVAERGHNLILSLVGAIAVRQSGLVVGW